ncbi:hypothetical protein GCM10010145_06130 [Streptomyces ruber]|uniref:Uncharacterized protein n=2 Tax=Streptomyces TaxID=1883 RepID=A0A918B775_9ACTN|nr:hypothetical protein GCM10010145_06130 [Streptomyces ruber]
MPDDGDTRDEHQSTGERLRSREKEQVHRQGGEDDEQHHDRDEQVLSVVPVPLQSHSPPLAWNDPKGNDGLATDWTAG